jgi:hypothetical protein
MKQKFSRRIPRLGAIAGTAVISLFATTAPADPEQKPVKFYDAVCVEIETTTFCNENSATLQLVTTPSGVLVSRGSGSTNHMQIDSEGNVFYEQTTEFRARFLSKEDIETQLNQWFSQETVAFGFTCRTEYKFKIVGGEIVFERTDSECVPDGT